MTDALCHELKLQNDYLQGESISTIYFGGGTPSLLNNQQLTQILNTLYSEYRIVNHPEITFEANPDDLNKAKLRDLFSAGINRLSIGIQSFHEEVLSFLNRAHDRQQALQCMDHARKAGFDNISIDLIYAIPPETHKRWHADLEQALQWQPEHISSYCLTIEPKTVFGHWLKKGNMPPIDDEFAATQFEILTHELSAAGYEQYEVSNFCLPGFYSKHNSSYWQQEKYLGIGPGAHSFNGITRQFNVSHNHRYIKSVGNGQVPYELDVLNTEDRINEYLLTTLRTKWGANLEELKKNWQYDLEKEQQNYLHDIIKNGYAFIDENHHLKLTGRGMLLADKISSDLFKLA